MERNRIFQKRGRRYRLNTWGYLIVEVEKNRWMLKHRWVMEKKLKRKLSSDEIVHHINHHKLDNRLKNLQITTQKEHPKLDRLHRKK